MPDTVTQSLILTGQFATVWNCKLQGKMLQTVDVAIKKVICKYSLNLLISCFNMFINFQSLFFSTSVAEYKDVWKIERKLTNNNELRANIYKERTVVQLNNQLIENFLQELIIMRQFEHPNVLSLIGISIHNNKPCALLPLMVNKDVRTFLKAKPKVSNFIFIFKRSKLHFKANQSLLTR